MRGQEGPTTLNGNGALIVKSADPNPISSACNCLNDLTNIVQLDAHLRVRCLLPTKGKQAAAIFNSSSRHGVRPSILIEFNFDLIQTIDIFLKMLLAGNLFKKKIEEF